MPPHESRGGSGGLPPFVAAPAATYVTCGMAALHFAAKLRGGAALWFPRPEVNRGSAAIDSVGRLSETWEYTKRILPNPHRLTLRYCTCSSERGAYILHIYTVPILYMFCGDTE